MDIAVLDDYQSVALEVADWSRLQGQGRVDVFGDHLTDPGALVDRLRPYGAVVLMRERTPFPAEVIDRLPELQLIVTTGRRNPVLDLSAASRRGIVVSHTRGLSSSTSELTWTLITGLSRHLLDESRNLATGGWQTTVGRDLAGTTLGVLGFGRIGQQVAAVGRAFGMHVLGHSRSLDSEHAEAQGAEAVGFEDLLRRSDVVSLHLPLDDATRGIIATAELSIMKPGALLINTSRGPLVDDEALAAALATGHLGGAGIDVFDHEPPPADHPWRDHPRVLATPHLGYVTRNGLALFYADAVDDIEAFLAGRPVRVLT